MASPAEVAELSEPKTKNMGIVQIKSGAFEFRKFRFVTHRADPLKGELASI